MSFLVAYLSSAHHSFGKMCIFVRSLLRSKHPRVEPSGTAPPPPSSTDTTSSEAFVDLIGATVAAVPTPSTSDDFDIHRTLETVLTIQAVHGQLLVDMLDELHALRANLAHLRHSPSPPPFDDGF